MTSQKCFSGGEFVDHEMKLKAFKVEVKILQFDEFPSFTKDSFEGSYSQCIGLKEPPFSIFQIIHFIFW